MGRFAAFVKMTTKPGERAGAVDVFDRYMDTIESEEGTLAYVLATDAADEDVLWLYEEYADDSALEVHLGTEAYAAMRDEITPYMAAMPEMIVVDPVRTKGAPR